MSAKASVVQERVTDEPNDQNHRRMATDVAAELARRPHAAACNRMRLLLARALGAGVLVIAGTLFLLAGDKVIPVLLDDEPDATELIRESFRYYRSGSPFEYDMVRMLYTAKRKIEVAK